MADVPTPKSAAAAVAEPPILAENHRRNAWFAATPDPWEEMLRLEPGSDRTHATTVYRTIVNAGPAQHAEFEHKLIAGLGRVELTHEGRRFICRMLGLIGTAACVPVVAPLLRRADTADDARIALDPISGPEADAAYRAALAQLDGAPLAGLIGSIGLRGDVQARDAIAAIAADGKRAAAVRTVAARVAARLGGKEAQS